MPTVNKICILVASSFFPTPHASFLWLSAFTLSSLAAVQTGGL